MIIITLSCSELMYEQKKLIRTDGFMYANNTLWICDYIWHFLLFHTPRFWWEKYTTFFELWARLFLQSLWEGTVFMNSFPAGLVRYKDSVSGAEKSYLLCICQVDLRYPERWHNSAAPADSTVHMVDLSSPKATLSLDASLHFHRIQIHL